VKPLLDIIEGLIVGHIVNHDDTVGPSVVGRSDGAETLLSSSIPDLELDCLTIQLNSTNFLWRRKAEIQYGVSGKPASGLITGV